MLPDEGAGSLSRDELVNDVVARVEELRKGGQSFTLEELCRACPELLDSVRQALREVRLIDDLLGEDIDDPAGTCPSVPAEVSAELPAVPGYEVLGELGRGGMGVVYHARQLKLRRPVALKMILAGAHAGANELARFRREAEAAAHLQHPNIVPIYEVGEQDGQPYLALEYVDGGSLDRKLAGTPLPARAAGQLVQTLARAVAYAHERGVIHRDLKPANVLLVPSDRPEAVPLGGAGDAVGPYEPRVTDFGLAKRLEGAPGVSAPGNPTRSGVILGTPSYMAPEQTEGHSQQVGPAVDVYALGAILYECLTGRPPFKAATELETLLQVRADEPVPPRRLQPKLPRDLETITLKCLQKEPHKRYADAEALAEDLGRFLGCEPIKARPIGVWERGGKWVKRRPAVAALVVLVPLAAALGFAGVTWQWLRAEERGRTAELARQAEVEQREKAEDNLYANRIALAHREWLANTVVRAEALLNDCPSALVRWEWHYLKRLCRSDLHTLHGHTRTVGSVAFSPDSRHVASTSLDQTIRLWDLTSGREVLALRAGSTALSVAFGPDGRRLASAHGDKAVRVWDITTGENLLTLRGHTRPVLSVAFVAGQRLLSAGLDQMVRSWDAATGREIVAFQADGMADSAGSVLPNCMAFSADGSRLATWLDGRTLRVWDAAARKELHRLDGHTALVTAAAFGPDGRHLASVSMDRTVKLWDVSMGRELRTFYGHGNGITSVAFSPDGRLLASAGHDLAVRVWDVTTGQQLRCYRGHPAAILAVAFSPDGRLLASGGDLGMVKVWDATADQSAHDLNGHTKLVSTVAFSPDSTLLASASADGTVQLWDVSTRKNVRTLRGHSASISGVAFSPSRRHIVSSGGAGELKIWDLDTGRELRALTGHEGTVRDVAFAPDGRHIASAGEDQTIRVWDATTGQEVLTLRGHGTAILSVAFSPDGSRLASGGRDYAVRIWDARTGEEVRILSGHVNTVTGVAFSSDGRHLASVGSFASPSLGGEVKVWDLETGQVIHSLRGHTRLVGCFAFSPDGRRLASGSKDHTVKIWDVIRGLEILTLEGHRSSLYSVAFSPDGKYLASASYDGTVKIWDGAPLN